MHPIGDTFFTTDCMYMYMCMCLITLKIIISIIPFCKKLQRIVFLVFFLSGKKFVFKMTLDDPQNDIQTNAQRNETAKKRAQLQTNQNCQPTESDKLDKSNITVNHQKQVIILINIDFYMYTYLLFVLK